MNDARDVGGDTHLPDKVGLQAGQQSEIAMTLEDTLSIQATELEANVSASDQPSMKRRRSDHGPTRHITLGMAVGLLAAVFGPLMAMQVWTIQLASDAKIAALSARPYPYTSLDATKDWEGHSEVHNITGTASRHELQALLGQLEERLVRRIDTLERPPKDIVKMLDTMKAQVTRLETVVEQMHK